MKLPRWLVICLLVTSASLAIVVPAWCWVTWPARTLREFTTLLEQGRFEEADEFLPSSARLTVEEHDNREYVVFDSGQPRVGNGYVPLYSPESWRSWCTLENLQTERRTFLDVLLGRQEFSFHRQFTTPLFIGGHAERGSIVLRYENWAASSF